MAAFIKRMQSNLKLRPLDGEVLEDERVEYKQKTTREHVLDELRLQARLASPVVLGYLLQMSLNLVRVDVRMLFMMLTCHSLDRAVLCWSDERRA